MRLTVFVVATFLLIGCSKNFSHREAYKFDYHVSRPVLRADTTPGTLPAPGVINPASVSAQTGDVAGQLQTLSTQHAIRQNKDEGRIKATAAHVVQPRKAFVKSEITPRRNWAAITSIILGLTVYPLGLLTAPLAILFGIIGLRSKRRTLAIIGICLGVAYFVYLAILFLFFFAG